MKLFETYSILIDFYVDGFSVKNTSTGQVGSYTYDLKYPTYSWLFDENIYKKMEMVIRSTGKTSSLLKPFCFVSIPLGYSFAEVNHIRLICENANMREIYFIENALAFFVGKYADQRELTKDLLYISPLTISSFNITSAYDITYKTYGFSDPLSTELLAGDYEAVIKDNNVINYDSAKNSIFTGDIASNIRLAGLENHSRKLKRK